MISKGRIFLINNKVYRMKINLIGYDEYFIRHEISRLLSLNIVEKVRNATKEDKNNEYIKLIEYPKC